MKPRRHPLRIARERAGLSQQQLAEAAFVPKSAIADIETGRNLNPSFSRVMALMRALKHHGVLLDDRNLRAFLGE